MARPHPLRILMNSPLPPSSEQRLNCYRPSIREVCKIYSVINKYVFGHRLTRPPIELGICRGSWGWCHGNDNMTRKGTYCRIKLADKWPYIQSMVTTLAHEMVHQYQWDIGRLKRERMGREIIMSHGPSFFEWRSKLLEFNINLHAGYFLI